MRFPWLRIFAVAAGLSAALFSAATADTQLKAKVVRVAGSPVTINGCEAWIRDFYKSSLGFHDRSRTSTLILASISRMPRTSRSRLCSLGGRRSTPMDL